MFFFLLLSIILSCGDLLDQLDHKECLVTQDLEVSVALMAGKETPELGALKEMSGQWGCLDRWATFPKLSWPTRTDDEAVTPTKSDTDGKQVRNGVGWNQV